MVLKKAFTLVELLIVMAILAIMMVILIGILDPKAMITRANDARMKKDINRIRAAMEEYINDKRCYPTQAEIDALICGQPWGNWLRSWPCRPDGAEYYVFTDDRTPNCAKWFRILVELGNEKDNDVPPNWTSYAMVSLGNGTINGSQANYGASSSNVKWNDIVYGPSCTYYPDDHTRDTCSEYVDGVCNHIKSPGELGGCVGPNCFAINGCDQCLVPCCGNMCP